jgi:uncharacterized protein YqcC (DUF446 family)
MGSNTMNQVADIILLLEAELRRIGLWEEAAPEKQALESTLPFCHDSLEFHQWLQWVLIPKTRELIEKDIALPTTSDIAALAEYRFEQMPQETDALLKLIREFDRLLSEGKTSP